LKATGASERATARIFEVTKDFCQARKEVGACIGDASGAFSALFLRLTLLGERQCIFIRKQISRVESRSGRGKPYPSVRSVHICRDPQLISPLLAGSQEWFLVIGSSSYADEGLYECQVSSRQGGPEVKQKFALTVVGEFRQKKMMITLRREWILYLKSIAPYLSDFEGRCALDRPTS